MTDYLCFSPRRILRRFIDLWLALVTSVSTFPIWYQWHYYSSNMTRIIRALFDPVKRQIRHKVCLHALLAFFSARASCEGKLAMKWYPMRMCSRWLGPFNFSTCKIKAVCVCLLYILPSFWNISNWCQNPLHKTNLINKMLLNVFINNGAKKLFDVSFLTFKHFII